MGDDDDGRARAAWQALQSASRTDEQLRELLMQLTVSPDQAELGLREWLSEKNHPHAPDLATYVSGGQVEQLVNIARARTVNVVARPPVTSLFRLPRDISDFTGRQADIGELLELLGGGGYRRKAVVISALAGKPGVGKSALAIHVAHRLRDSYPDAQLYVNLRGAEPECFDPWAVLAGFLEAFGLKGDEIPQSIDRCASLYRSQLEGRRALIVLDNARDAAQVRPLLPASTGCAVLVTSRSPLAGLDGVHLRAVDVIDRGSAVEFLGKLAGAERVSAELEEARELVQRCACLPLALRICGGLLAKEPLWTLAKLARRLRDERQRLDELRLGDLEVRGSLTLSYDALDEDAARVFRRLAALSGPEFGLGVVAALDDAEPDVAERVLERLVDAQLVEEPAEDRYRFHDLIALFARERADAEESADARELAGARARAWYLWHARFADFFIRTERTQVDRFDVTVSVQARAWGLRWLTLEHTNLVASTEQAHAAQDWQATLQLADTLMKFLAIRAHWHDWSRTQALALDAARQSNDRAGQVRALTHLGNACGAQGCWEDAVVCHKESLRTMRELGDHRGEAAVLGNLGNSYLSLGRWDDAIGCYRHSLRATRELGDRRGEAQPLISLGNVYARRGARAEAIICYEQGLLIMRELADRYGEAQSLLNIGGVYHQEGRLDDALECYEQSLATMRELGDRHGEAQALGNLGAIRADQERWQDAAGCYETSLTTMRALGDRSGEAHALSNLGYVYVNLGRSDDAMECHDQSLETMRELGDQYGEAQTLAQRGSFYSTVGRWDDAIASYARSLEIMRELGDHGSVAASLANLAHVYARVDRLDEATATFQHSLEIIRELGDRRREVTVLGRLALLHAQQGRVPESIAFCEQSLTISRELGDRHGEADALYRFGLVLGLTGDQTGATRHLRDALAVFDELGAPESESVRAALGVSSRPRWWRRRRAHNSH